MIYFNIQQQTIERQRCINARQAERIAELTEEREALIAENEALQESLDSGGLGMWELVAMKDRAIGEYAQIVAELKAEKDELIAENVRLTGQVHALLARLEAQL